MADVEVVKDDLWAMVQKNVPCPIVLSTADAENSFRGEERRVTVRMSREYFSRFMRGLSGPVDLLSKRPGPSSAVDPNRTFRTLWRMPACGREGRLPDRKKSFRKEQEKSARIGCYGGLSLRTRTRTAKFSTLSRDYCESGTSMRTNPPMSKPRMGPSCGPVAVKALSNVCALAAAPRNKKSGLELLEGGQPFAIGTPCRFRHAVRPTMSNWHTISESRFPWEREALEFVRAKFPAHEPYHAWTNFEFVADDGSVNEVDLLVFSPMGFYLIEIKSLQGQLTGDAGTWTWRRESSTRTMDNPLISANSKARKLKSLLERQKAIRATNHRLPYLDALVFLSREDLQVSLRENGRMRVCGRGGDSAGGLPGLLGAITRRECPGLEREPRGMLDRPMARAVAQALEQAGVRSSSRLKKVSDYELEEIVGEGPGYQDWAAKHSSLPNVRRRVRIYLVHRGATEDERKTIQRAAEREVQLLDVLRHPGILPVYGYTEHELGPALIFDFDGQAERLGNTPWSSHRPQEERQKLQSSRCFRGCLRRIGGALAYFMSAPCGHCSTTCTRAFPTTATSWDAGAASGTETLKPLPAGISSGILPTSFLLHQSPSK